MKVLATIACLCVPGAGWAEGIVVTPADFDGAWIFKADTITLHCGLWEDTALVVFTADDRIFPLDEAALIRSFENQFAPLGAALTIPTSRTPNSAANRAALAELAPLAASARRLCPT